MRAGNCAMLELPVSARALEELRSAVAEGPVVLETHSRGLAEAAVSRLAPKRPLIAIDPRGAGTTGGLRVDVARALLAILLERDDIEAKRVLLDTRDRLAIGRAFGPRAEEALSLAAGSLESSVSLDDLLSAVPESALLVVHDAHLLGEPWARRALWSLRARAAEAAPPWMLLLTRPWQTGLTDREAAFFGFARRLELPVPKEADWARALSEAGSAVHPDDLRWLTDQTVGNPDVTVEALRNDARNVRRGWRACVGARRGVLDLVLNAARAAHPFGPRLLVAVARGEPPYPAVPDAKPARVAHALRRLRDHGFVYQPAPRTWRLADAALAAALREPAKGNRGSPRLSDPANALVSGRMQGAGT
jgi:hypothetical protein